MGISVPGGFVVAVDGPSGSGKSSASRGAARALGLRYLDTGAMYRALTWWLMSHDYDTKDERHVASLAAQPVIEVSTDPDDAWTRVDGTDVSEEIRTREVSAQVSVVARVPEVRQHLIGLQRGIIKAAAPGIVAEGRDIGTVVAPNAQLKVYLTADSQARAERRAAERGAAVDVTEADQARRDRLDAAQSAKADDAVLIDATDLSLPAVIDTITRLAREAAPLTCGSAARGQGGWGAGAPQAGGPSPASQQSVPGERGSSPASQQSVPGAHASWQSAGESSK